MYLYEKYKIPALLIWAMICVYLFGVHVGVKFPTLAIAVAIGLVIVFLAPAVRNEAW